MFSKSLKSCETFPRHKQRQGMVESDSLIAPTICKSIMSMFFQFSIHQLKLCLNPFIDKSIVNQIIANASDGIQEKNLKFI